MEEKHTKNDTFLKDTKKVKIIVGIALILIIIVLSLILLLRKPEYQITFETNGGSPVETITVKKNNKIPKPEDPVKENYKFAGWFYKDELFDFSKPVTSDMTLEAKWISMGNSEGIKLDRTELVLNIGETSKIIILAMPENISEESLIWESSNSDIVSVDSNGNIKAIKAGNVTITVRTEDGEYSAMVNVTVKQEDTSEDVNKETVENEKVENEKVENEKVDNEKNDDEKVDNETDKGEAVVKVTGVTLDKASLSLTEGDTAKLTATVNPSNATNKDVTWSSSNTKIVTVDSNGNIKALKAGNATITVTTKDGGYSATANVTVKEASVVETVVKVTGVTLNKTSLSLTEGDSSSLTATVNPSNATNKDVTWSSSNNNIVSVDSNGNIKALKAGNATITVTTKDGNYKASCQVTVAEKAPTYSVIIEPKPQEVTGAILQYAVSATKNNSSFSDFDKIVYNNKPVGTYLSSKQYNKDITTATIKLSDGTNVTATVIYR